MSEETREMNARCQGCGQGFWKEAREDVLCGECAEALGRAEDMCDGCGIEEPEAGSIYCADCLRAVAREKAPGHAPAYRPATHRPASGSDLEARRIHQESAWWQN